MRSIPIGLGVIASLIAIFGAIKALEPEYSTSATAEAKEIVGFHQVTNRICVENHQALERALPEAHSKVQLLAFLSRGTGWGINDLESVTAPPSLADHFDEEIALRRGIQANILELQRAGETGDLESKAKAAVAIVAEEGAATETDHELGLRRCASVLPPKVRKAIEID
jgi:hypothetical protein